MRLCDILYLDNSADFGSPGSIVVDKTSSEEEQKRIGDKRAREFQAENETISMNLPANLNWEALRWIGEGMGRNPVFGKPPKKMWSGRLQYNNGAHS